MGVLATEPMTIDDLLTSANRRSYAAMPEADALTQADALQEADLVDVRLLASGGSLGLLLDLRTALQFRMANTAVLVMRGVERLSWTRGEPPELRRVAHYVMSDKPAVWQGLFSLEVACLRGWYLEAAARSAEFFVGNVPHLPEAPPNFVDDDDRAIAAGMPARDSNFNPEWATFIDPVPSAGRH